MSDVSLVGNLTRDPELRYTPAGRAVVGFGLAVNRIWTDDAGERQEAVGFFDVSAWGDLAENIAETLTKGNRVIVVGRLDYRTWETPEGDKRSKVEIVAAAVGPSLQWATATVVRNERTEPAADEHEQEAPKRRRSPLRAAG